MKGFSNTAGMVIATVIWLVVLLFAGFAAMMSPMMFDAPGSDKNSFIWTLFTLVALTPVAILAGVAMAWVFHGFGKARRAWLSMAFPLAWIAVTAIVMFNWK
ncbi:MAG: hypothetical protein ACXW3D_00940 [Caulobacteraceae bacterium]